MIQKVWLEIFKPKCVVCKEEEFEFDNTTNLLTFGEKSVEVSKFICKGCGNVILIDLTKFKNN